MYNLYLDDIRMPYESGNYMYPVELRSMYRLEEWVIVRSYTKFTRYIKRHGMPNKVSFDHDLHDSHYEGVFDIKAEKTGYDCAKWLVEYCIEKELPLPEYYSHSMNPIGKENILNYLKNYESRNIRR